MSSAGFISNEAVETTVRSFALCPGVLLVVVVHVEVS